MAWNTIRDHILDPLAVPVTPQVECCAIELILKDGAQLCGGGGLALDLVLLQAATLTAATSLTRATLNDRVNQAAREVRPFFLHRSGG